MATLEQATETIDVENPATGEVIRSLPVTTADDVRAMADRARAAQPAWEALGFEGRGRVLRRMQKWLVDNGERVIQSIVDETGKTYEDAAVVELAYGAGALGFWAKHAPDYLSDEKIRTSNPFVLGRKLVVRYRPVGIVGVIGPWNYPLTNSFGDAIPALAAGNAVLLKPSEVTPLTSMVLADGFRECGMPENVLQIAVGGAETGTALIDAVDFVMFTGSTATGKKVMARAAETLTGVALELGGKDPMIVLADADIERAANAATYYSMQNGGQTCVSVERVYVEAPIYDRFVDAVTERVQALRQGPPSGPASVEVGAMTFPPQMDIVSRHVEQAREAGARITTGGHVREGAGRFYEPTVLADVDHSMDGDARRDVRADRADHEGRRRRGGDPAGQRLAVRARRVGVDEGPRARRADRPPDRERLRLRERRERELLRLRAADGRLEGLRARRPPRRRAASASTRASRRSSSRAWR